MDTFGSWEDVPEHLKTRTSLKKMGLRLARGQKPVAIKTHRDYKIPDYHLYDVREAVPNVVTDAQRAAIDKAKAASLEKRTCLRCGFVEELGRNYRGKAYVVGGLCPDCREDDRHASDRDEASELARAMLQQDGVLILDTETTDLNGEIIELAIIDLKGREVYNQRFKPTETISEGAQAVHGISEADLINAPPFKDEILGITGMLLRAETVLIYNAAFDVGRLNYTCRLYGLEMARFKHTCLMLWYAQWVNDWSSYHQSYRWQPLNGGHSALDDCRAALACLHEMAQVS